MREALGGALSDAGYQVVLAQRGAEAIARAAIETFDLVVSDIKMPGIDGLQAVESVKKQQPSIKSIIVTGYSNKDNTLRAVELGVSDFLKKPFRLDDFLNRVKEVLDQRYRELKQLRELQLLERACLVALRGLAQLADSPHDRVRAAAKYAAHLLNNEEHSLRQIAELVTLLAGIQSVSRDLALPDFGPLVQDLLECCGERWDGSGPAGLRGEEIPLISRVVGLALARHLHPPEEFREQAHDPTLLRIAKQAQAPRTPPTGQDEREAQQLLSLARTMELANDLETAHQSYLDIVDRALPFRQKLEAQVGLARVADLTGLKDDCLTWIGRAMEGAEERGPDVSGRTDLTLGLLLLAHDRSQAELLLQQAERSLTDAGDTLGKSQALLAQKVIDPEWSEQAEQALEWLFRVEHRDLLKESSPWLLLALLQARHPSFTRLLKDYPSALRRMVERYSLPDNTCDYLLDFLEDFDDSAQLLPGLRSLNHCRDRPRVQALLHRLATLEGELPALRIHTFGQFEVHFGEERLSATRWKRKKIRYLLAYLARNWRKPVPEDRVLDQFWPGPLDRAKRSLYQATWELRRSLKLEQWPQLDYIQRHDGHLSLSSNFPLWRDIEEFERACQEGSQLRDRGEHESAARSFQGALKLLRGSFLEDCYQDWAVETRESVLLQTVEASQFLSREAFSRQQYEDCLKHATRLAELEPFRGEGHLLALQALSQLGRRAELVKWFDSYALHLKEEMNLEPMPQVVQAYEEALRGKVR